MTLSEEIAQCRARFVAWVNWYMAKEKLSLRRFAKQADVSPSTMTQLLAEDTDRSPSLETLVGVKRALGFPMEVLLYGDAPKEGGRRR